MKDWEAWCFSLKMDYHYISNEIAQQERQRKFWVLAKVAFSLESVVEFGFRAFEILCGQSEETLITVFFCFWSKNAVAKCPVPLEANKLNISKLHI